MIPKHRIPKIKPECIMCASTNVSTVMSQQFSAGYHRRHICNECDAPFYTLAKYDKTGYDRQDRPFKDRPLTPWEQQQRLEWASEGRTITTEVTTQFATEFIETINEAFSKHLAGADLSPEGQRIVETINQLERKIYDHQE